MTGSSGILRSIRRVVGSAALGAVALLLDASNATWVRAHWGAD